MSLRVRACGRDGLTGVCDRGRRHRITWDRVLGHKARMLQRWTVVDQGADGAVLEDEKGRRRYVAGALPASELASAEASEPAREEADEDPLMAGLDRTLRKSLETGMPPLPSPPPGLVLFLKAVAGVQLASRPGLSLRPVTDRAGHQTRRWVRTTPEQRRQAQGRARPDQGAAAPSRPVAPQLASEQARERPSETARAPAFPARQAGETDGAYLARTVREMPEPERLPEEHDRYFHRPEGTETVPLDRLDSSKSDEENGKGGANAARAMHAAYHGHIAKRDPITVERGEGGRYIVKDGNGTLAAARRHGWKEMPVQVRGGEAGSKHGSELASSQDSERASAPAAAAPPPLFEESRVAELPPVAAQPVKTKEALYAEAPKALDHLQTWLDRDKGVLTRLGFATMTRGPDDVPPDDWEKPGGMLFIARLKGEKRAAEKVEADYGGDWSQLRDVVRCSIAVDTHDQLREVLSTLQREGLDLAMRPKDRFVKPVPVGYRDLLMNVRLPPNGMIAEVQLHVKPMLKAKNLGHHDYEVERSLDAKAKGGKPLTDEERAALRAAQERQKHIYEAAWQAAVAGPSRGGPGAGEGEPMTKALRPGARGGKRYTHFEHDGAYYRRAENGLTRSVDDVLRNGRWVPYKGSDPLYPALFGNEVADPLGSERASSQLRKAQVLFVFPKGRGGA